MTLLLNMERENNGEKDKVVPIESAQSHQAREQEEKLRAEAAEDPKVKRALEEIERIKKETLAKIEQAKKEYIAFDREVKEGKRPQPTELDLKRFGNNIRKKYKEPKEANTPPDLPKDTDGV